MVGGFLENGSEKCDSLKRLLSNVGVNSILKMPLMPGIPEDVSWICRQSTKSSNIMTGWVFEGLFCGIPVYKLKLDVGPSGGIKLMILPPKES
jgi:hypothetical protein